jgi:hypothetical protein
MPATAIIKTSNWFTPLDANHLRVGISRGTPRGQPAGFRIYRKLAPGPWFNSCATHQEYERLYRQEILDPLDPRAVADELLAMASGRIPTLLCFEVAGKPGWCHRSLCSEWLAEALGLPVPEYGYEHLAQADHPLMSPVLRKARAAAAE